ncbi:MAG: hypothetical protein AB9834_12220 [Lentimicrobium sp.]
MGIINRTNYEVFVISYLDGTLDPVETAELLIFLEQNPDLKEEVSGIGSIVVNPVQEVQYDFKELLKQPPDVNAVNLTDTNYQHYFIAAHEGDLSPVGLNSVKTFIGNHADLKKEYELFAAARLLVDPAISFPNPGQLKKPLLSGIRKLIYLAAAAASILILVTLYLRIEPVGSPGIAEKTGSKEVTNERLPDKKNNPTVKPGGKSNSANTPEKEKAAVKITKTADDKKDSQPLTPSERNSDEIKQIPARQILNITPEPYLGAARNFYSDLFEDITKSQEPMLARLEQESPELPENSSLSSKTGRRVGSLLRNGAQIATQVNQSFSGWMLADIGIEGINALTDNDLKLERIANSDGSTGKVQITENGSGYSFSRNPN